MNLKMILNVGRPIDWRPVCVENDKKHVTICWLWLAFVFEPERRNRCK